MGCWIQELLRSRKALNFLAAFAPGEMLYVRTSKSIKYKAKSWSDMLLGLPFLRGAGGGGFAKFGIATEVRQLPAENHRCLD